MTPPQDILDVREHDMCHVIVDWKPTRCLTPSRNSQTESLCKQSSVLEGHSRVKILAAKGLLDPPTTFILQVVVSETRRTVSSFECWQADKTGPQSIHRCLLLARSWSYRSRNPKFLVQSFYSKNNHRQRTHILPCSHCVASHYCGWCGSGGAAGTCY
jgi:hypothetical protein